MCPPAATPPWHPRHVLIDVVLETGGSYWRKRLDLPAPPAPGAALALLQAPPLVATVVGSTEPEDGGGAASPAVLVRAAAPGPGAVPEAELRSAGWRCLL